MQPLRERSQPQPVPQRTQVGRLRRMLGICAILATVPYIALKLNWIGGGTLGMANPAFFQGPFYFYANIITLGMDIVAAIIALIFSTAWGARIPALLILPPTWLATGFLLPIVALLPVVPLTASWPTSANDPLESWVYLVVYGGFALQGFLLLLAFVLYAQARWHTVLRRLRVSQAQSPTRRSALLVLVGCAIAGVVGVLHVVWAAGAPLGLQAAYIAQQTASDRLSHAIFGTFAFGAAVGVAMLVFGRGGRLAWGPLALSWAGTGAMVAWGSWLLLTGAVNAPAAPGYFIALLAQVSTGLLLACAALRLEKRSFF